MDPFFRKKILLEKQPHKHLFTIQNLALLTNNFLLAQSPTFTPPLALNRPPCPGEATDEAWQPTGVVLLQLLHLL